MINCYLETKGNSLFDKSDVDNNSIQISKITIEDNGEGFNDENLMSLKEYGTNYKTGEWEAKGTGRFCFFKIVDEIVYKSLGQKITLTKKGLIEATSAFTEENKTTLELNHIKYKPPTLGELDIEKIPNSIKSSLLPTFILIKENNFLDKIEINFYQNHENFGTILLTDVPNVEKASFSVKSELNNISCDFDLLYYVAPNSKHDNPVQISGYCANFIKVKAFNFNINLPKSPYIFLVKGQYFDDNANDSRTDFIIKSQERGITNFLNWKEIDEILKKIFKISSISPLGILKKKIR